MIYARRLLALITLAGLLTVNPGFAGDERSDQAGINVPTVTIEIKDLKFVPDAVTVPVGTTIQWVNLDPVDHDVTSGVSINGRKARGMKQTKYPDDKFSSGLFGKDKSFSIVVDKPGEYAYYCNIHPFMTAKVIVE